MKFGDKVKKLRELRGMTQDELANSIGFTESYVSAIERGAKDNPPLNTIRALAKSLGVRESYLIDENAITFDELAESVGKQIPQDVADFILNKESLPYLILAKSLEEQKVPKEYFEIALNSVISTMKKTTNPSNS